MSKKELDEAIFQFQRPTRPGFKVGPAQFVTEDIPKEQVGEASCFNVRGESTKDEIHCAAKQVTTPKGVRYFAKWCLDGPDKGHLLNPYSIYFREGDDTKTEQRRGKLRYEFRLISKAAFDSYVSFLKSKLYVHCQAAEREILNA